MIIYGSKATGLASENINHDCPGCGADKSITMHIFQRYGHVFWIPLFPFNKIAVSECNNCKQVLRRKEFPKTFNERHQKLKAEAKTPWWTFAGLLLLALLITSGIVASKMDDKENAQLVLEPKPGDVYEVKLAYNEYTLYKVDRVEGGMVYLFENEYSTDKTSGFRDLGKKPFTDESYPIAMTDLKLMLENGEILDIERH